MINEPTTLSNDIRKVAILERDSECASSKLELSPRSSIRSEIENYEPEPLPLDDITSECSNNGDS